MLAKEVVSLWRSQSPRMSMTGTLGSTTNCGLRKLRRARVRDFCFFEAYNAALEVVYPLVRRIGCIARSAPGFTAGASNNFMGLPLIGLISNTRGIPFRHCGQPARIRCMRCAKNEFILPRQAHLSTNAPLRAPFPARVEYIDVAFRGSSPVSLLPQKFMRAGFCADETLLHSNC